MNVHVKCLLDLSRENICDHRNSTLHEVPAGTTAGELASILKLDPAKIHLVFINYKESTLDAELHDEDDVAFSPI